MLPRIAMIIGIALALAACNASISTEIYLADIDELSGGKELTASVMIGLPISGQDDCAEKKQRYAKVFRKSKGFKDMEFVRCYADGYDDLAEYELEVPMRLVDPETTSMIDAFEIVRYDDPDTDSSALYLRSNPSYLCDLDELISDEFWQSLDLSGASPQIVITNDLRDTQYLILEHVFVNGAPVIEPRLFEMERRDSLRVALSNVTSAWVFSKSCAIRKRSALVGIWSTDAASLTGD